MNELDQFVKHKLKIKYYIRYADDFIVLSDNKDYLEQTLGDIRSFLGESLKLNLHPNKISIGKVSHGIDFLGYVVLPHHRQLRTKTKHRIFKKLKQKVAKHKAGQIDEDKLKQTLNSFLGVLSHANSYKLKQELLNQYWFWMKE